ncbi:MAG: amino acid permease [Actinobacteria bacterium]|nr:MAG: amino acid permease [Actinomycetota bacterium]
MSTGPATGGHHASEDEQLLHRMGYAQELFRAMKSFQNFAISFTIISILAGCLTSYYIAFQWGGPIAVTWGWLIVGGFCIVVSLAMAEIASTYPTAGGLYFWASKLGGPSWGWFTGWFNLIGQIAVTAAIGYGLAIFATSFLDLVFNYPNNKHWIFVTYTVVMAIALVLNLFAVSITSLLNSISAWWHMAGVAFIVLVLIIVPDHHRSIGYVFGQTINNSGFQGHNFGNIMFWYVFGIGLLMAQYTITGFDASAHMAEETHEASRGAAVGMYMSVVVSVIFGFVLLLGVTFAIPGSTVAKANAGAIAAGGNIVTYIWQTSMSTHWAEILLFIAVVAQMFCLTASVTSASRMMFAFSRDGAVPGWRMWRRIAKNRVPWVAVLAIGTLSWLLMVPTWWNNFAGYLVGDLPALAPGRELRAAVVARRQPLQVARPGRDRLDHPDLHPVHAPDRSGRDPVQEGLRLEHRQLRTGHGRRRVHPLRRLVRALGQEVVQGPGAHGNRGGARAAGGGAGEAVRPPGRVARLARTDSAVCEGRREAPLVTSEGHARRRHPQIAPISLPVPLDPCLRRGRFPPAPSTGRE